MDTIDSKYPATSPKELQQQVVSSLDKYIQMEFDDSPEGQEHAASESKIQMRKIRELDGLGNTRSVGMLQGAVLAPNGRIVQFEAITKSQNRIAVLQDDISNITHLRSTELISCGGIIMTFENGISMLLHGRDPSNLKALLAFGLKTADALGANLLTAKEVQLAAPFQGYEDEINGFLQNIGLSIPISYIYATLPDYQRIQV